MFNWFKGAGKPKPDPFALSQPKATPSAQASPGRPGLTPPARPTRRGKSPEQKAEERAAYCQAMRAHFAAIAKFERERCQKLGITRYRWMGVDVTDKCSVAKRNGGKTFAYANPPKEGHVGEGECMSDDWCRCYAEPIIPGFGK